MHSLAETSKKSKCYVVLSDNPNYWDCHLKPLNTCKRSINKGIEIFEPRREKTCLRGFANNKGADKPVHPRSLICAFVIRFLESTISMLATSEIFLLIPVAEQAG